MTTDKRIFAVGVIAASLFAAPVAGAEGQLRIAEQFGIGYLPLHVIRDQQLVEKHGKAAGLDIKLEWTKLGGGAAINDALLSGSIDIGAGGIGPLLTVWDRTRGNLNIKGIASLGSLPLHLVTRRPEIASLKDFGPNDKIALPAVKVSVQARILQIAAEKELGAGKHDALDNLTVTLAHPDATAALIAGASDVTAHFSSAPFQYQAVASGKVRKVLSSHEVLGGPQSSALLYARQDFREQSPKTYAAFLAALREAVDWINANKDAAADTYIRVEKSKLEKIFVVGLLNDPEIQFKLTPERVEVFAKFLHKIGALKRKPESWKELFFDEVSELPGS